MLSLSADWRYILRGSHPRCAILRVPTAGVGRRPGGRLRCPIVRARFTEASLL